MTRDLFALALYILKETYEAVDKISADIERRAGPSVTADTCPCSIEKQTKFDLPLLLTDGPVPYWFVATHITLSIATLSEDRPFVCRIQTA